MTTPTPLPVPFMELNKEFVPVVYESWAAQMRAYGLAEYQRGLKDALAAHEAQPSQDAKDAARYRWLKSCTVQQLDDIAQRSAFAWDEKIDTAMKDQTP